MAAARAVGWIAWAAACLGAEGALASTLEPHARVTGADVERVELRVPGGAVRSVAWDELERLPLEPMDYALHVRLVTTGDEASIEIPPCSGRARVTLDGHEVPAAPGPVVVSAGAVGSHDVVVDVAVSRYERRVACAERPRAGPVARTVEGLGTLSFSSPYGPRGGGRAVVFVPPGHDVRTPSALLVGAHPWNGSMWTYAAYAGLLREAQARDVVLLMPSGLGNSLYTADAEDEVMRAIGALADLVAVDPRRVSIWGASMGGAGATTIGFHHPDRFASVTSFFGDSKYDLSTYVRAILADEHGAHLVNALDVVDNARHLPVWLIHGEDDRTSPLRQSELLAVALRDHGFEVRFDRVAGLGHSGALVARFLPELVARAATARTPDPVARVTYRSVADRDACAYGVCIVRSSPRGDAFVDVERRAGAVHVRRAEGVRAILLAPGALGSGSATGGAGPPTIVVDDASGVRVGWGSLP